MIALSLSLLLYLFVMPEWVLADDVAATNRSPQAGEQKDTAEQKLSAFLDQDDIAGAMALLEQMATDGDIDAETRQALEDRVWQTKTQRMLEYSKKIREAIDVSDLEAMRDYNRRLRRLTAEIETKTAPDVETKTPDVKTPILGFAAANQEETIGTVNGSSTPAALDVAKIVTRPPVRIGNVPPEAKDGTEAAIADLFQRGERAIADFRLTVAPAGKDSALSILDQLLALGEEGKTAGVAFGQRILATYQGLIERNLARGSLDRATTFIERMNVVAERANLPRDQIEDLRAQIDQASS